MVLLIHQLFKEMNILLRRNKQLNSIFWNIAPPVLWVANFSNFSNFSNFGFNFQIMVKLVIPLSWTLSRLVIHYRYWMGSHLCKKNFTFSIFFIIFIINWIRWFWYFSNLGGINRHCNNIHWDTLLHGTRNFKTWRIQFKIRYLVCIMIFYWFSIHIIIILYINFRNFSLPSFI